MREIHLKTVSEKVIILDRINSGFFYAVVIPPISAKRMVIDAYGLVAVPKFLSESLLQHRRLRIQAPVEADIPSPAVLSMQFPQAGNHELPSEQLYHWLLRVALNDDRCLRGRPLRRATDCHSRSLANDVARLEVRS
jgi:hypothetical protein